MMMRFLSYGREMLMMGAMSQYQNTVLSDARVVEKSAGLDRAG